MPRPPHSDPHPSDPPADPQPDPEPEGDMNEAAQAEIDRRAGA